MRLIVSMTVLVLGLLGLQTAGLAETDEELLQDLRQEVRQFGQDPDGDFGSSLTLVLLGRKAYPVLLEALEDPKDPEHAATLEWLGDYNPEEFDLKAANRRMHGS